MLDERITPGGRLRLGDVLFRLYVFALCVPLLVVLAAQPVQIMVASTGAELPLGPAGVPLALALVTAVAATAVLGLGRTAVWHGPVVLAAADVAWLLASPQPRGELVRPRLVRTLQRSVAAGGAIGAVCGVLVAEVLGSGMFLRGTLGVAAGGGLALSGQALAWWVVGHPSRARLVLRVTPVAVVVLPSLVAGGVVAPWLAWGFAWSGPWGWAALVVAAPAPTATAASVLLAVTAAGATTWTLARAPSPPMEELARRSASGSGVGTALLLNDQRTARSIAREASEALRGPSRRRLPPPRTPRFAVVWRDATAAVRSPDRSMAGLVAATTAGTGISLGLGSLPGIGDLTAARGPWLWLLSLGCLGALVSGTMFLDPLRSALARPFGHVALPWSDRTLLRRHAAFPLGALLLGTLLGVLLATAFGLGPVPWPRTGSMAVAAGGLWVLAVVPALTVLSMAKELPPPPDPTEASMAMVSEIGAMQELVTATARALPAVSSVLVPTVLLAASATATAGATTAALLGLTAAWGASAGTLGWRWLRRRALPWQ